MIKTICLSGGALKGICTLGCLKELEKNLFLKCNNIDKFYCTSVGTILSLLIICGYTIEELSRFILKFDLNNLEPEIDCDILFNKMGITEGNEIIATIQTLIYEKLEVYDLNFKEFYEKTNKKIYIFTTNFTKSKEEIFSFDDTPDTSVVLALRMSIAVPFLFTPVNFNDCIYIDGGLTNNFPIDHINDPNFFGICLNFNNNIDNKDFYNFFLGCINTLVQTINFKNINIQNKNNILIINNLNNNEVSEFSFTLENKNKLFNLGKEFAIEYIKDNNPFVKKVITHNTIKQILDELITTLHN